MDDVPSLGMPLPVAAVLVDCWVTGVVDPGAAAGLEGTVADGVGVAVVVVLTGTVAVVSVVVVVVVVLVVLLVEVVVVADVSVPPTIEILRFRAYSW